MGALSFDALLRSLKHGAPNPVYYLHGDEEVLKAEAVRAVLERAVEAGARDFNVDDRSAAQLSVETLRALVDTPRLPTPQRCWCSSRDRARTRTPPSHVKPRRWPSCRSRRIGWPAGWPTTRAG